MSSSHSQPTADPVAHFKSIPWCDALLTDKSVLGIAVPDRTRTANTESQLVRVTLNTPDTVKACVTFFRMPSKAERQGNVGETREKPFVEIDCLLDVGDGLAGRPHVMHGGVFSVILDEVLSTVAYQHSGEFGPLISVLMVVWGEIRMKAGLGGMNVLTLRVRERSWRHYCVSERGLEKAAADACCYALQGKSSEEGRPEGFREGLVP